MTEDLIRRYINDELAKDVLREPLRDDDLLLERQIWTPWVSSSSSGISRVSLISRCGMRNWSPPTSGACGTSHALCVRSSSEQDSAPK